nr:MAG TPA: hypothetical protein [Bacteriophage sp.]
MGEMRRLTPARKAALTRTRERTKSGADAHAGRKERDDQRDYAAQM